MPECELLGLVLLLLFSPYYIFDTVARFVYASFLIQFRSLLSSSGQIFLEICNIVLLILEKLRLIGLPGSMPPLFEFFTSSLPYTSTSCLLVYPFGFALLSLLSSFSHCPFVLVIYGHIINYTKT